MSLRLLLTRCLWAIPTILVISIVSFLITNLVPNNPQLSEIKQLEGTNHIFYPNKDSIINAYYKSHNLDKPVFYFSICSLAEPDTLFRIPNKTKFNFIKKLLFQFGNWRRLKLYLFQLDVLNHKVAKIDSNHNAIKFELQNLVSQLNEETEENKLDSLIQFCNNKYGFFLNELNTLKQRFDELKNNKQIWKKYIPFIHWHGIDNQYHIWLSAIIQGNLPVSTYDRQPLADKILPNLIVSSILGLGALCLAVIGSMAFAKYRFLYPKNILIRLANVFLIYSYSVPNFWLASILLLLFANQSMLNWFPTHGLTSLNLEHQDVDWFTKLKDYVWHLTLPVIAFLLPILTVLTQQLSHFIQKEAVQPYAITVLAKGATRTILYQHLFSNSIIPYITLLGQFFLSIFSGSVIIETIFNLPGMGLMLYNAILVKDFPVLNFMFLFFSFCSVTTLIIIDVLTYIVDPRLKQP